MPRRVRLTQFLIDLHDAATGQTVKVDKAVDVSDICFFHEAGCVLLYGRATRGVLVQIVLPAKKGDPSYGMVTHYFLADLDRELLTKDTVLPSFARHLGLHSESLVTLLRREAP